MYRDVFEGTYDYDEHIGAQLPQVSGNTIFSQWRLMKINEDHTDNLKMKF